MNGKVIGLKENYFNQGDVFEGDNRRTVKLDYSDVQGPSLHGNCRCVLLPVLARSARRFPLLVCRLAGCRLARPFEHHVTPLMEVLCLFTGRGISRDTRLSGRGKFELTA